MCSLRDVLHATRPDPDHGLDPAIFLGPLLRAVASPKDIADKLPCGVAGNDHCGLRQAWHRLLQQSSLPNYRPDRHVEQVDWKNRAAAQSDKPFYPQDSLKTNPRNRLAIVKMRRKRSPKSPCLIMRYDQLIICNKDLPLFVQFAIEQEFHHAELRHLPWDNPPFVRDIGLQ